MGSDTPTAAAKKAGISASNFTRWKQGARADPDFVVKIARAYNADVLEALVAADFITADEAGRSATDFDVQMHTALKIVNMHAKELEYITGDLVRQVRDYETRRTISNIPSPGVEPPIYAVADSSPDEDALREAEEGDVD